MRKEFGRLDFAEAGKFAIFYDDLAVKFDGRVVLNHVDVNGGTCRLAIVEAVAHSNVAGAACFFLFFEVAVEEASRVQADADLCDVVAVFNFSKLTAVCRSSRWGRR